MEAGFIPTGYTTAPLAAAPASKVIRPPGLKRGNTEVAISDRVSETLKIIKKNVLYVFVSMFIIIV